MNNQTLTAQCDSKAITRGENGGSPFIFEFFLVQGLNFCCMAYRDDNDKWRMAFNNMELQGDVCVVA